MSMHFPEFILVACTICRQRSIPRFCPDTPYVLADEVAHRPVHKENLARVNIVLSQQWLGLLVEPFAKWALKVCKFFDLDRRIRIAYGIVVCVWMRSRLYSDNFSDRSKRWPDDSKDQQRRANRNQTNGQQTPALLLLAHFLTPFLAFTL